MKQLLIGDLHTQINNLDDTRNLFKLIQKTVLEHDVQQLVFLGDLFHSHSVVRQEIIQFYQEVMEELTHVTNAPIMILVGNHDGNSPDSITPNAVTQTLSHISGILVVDKPVYDNSNKSLYLPFMSDKQQFVDSAGRINVDILYCHQTFQGAQYENGFYAPDGIDQDSIDAKLIVSGHIHKYSTLGKVFYAGTPRAVSAAEANQSKYIWLFDTDTLERTGICADKYVKCYKEIVISNEIQDDFVTLLSEQNLNKDDVRVRIIGNEEFYQSTLAQLKEFHGKAKFIPEISIDINSVITIKDPNNLEMSFKQYIYEVCDMSHELKDKVWTKVQKMANLDRK